MRMRNPKYKDEVIEKCDFWYAEDATFTNENPIHIEIGMGKGNFILNMALTHPEINFIGIEKYASVASVAIKKMLNYKLPNLKIIINDVLNLENVLKNKVSVIYLNFSDPWPKKRHEKRRLTSPDFLNLYDTFFKGKGVIIQKTDNDDLFAYSIDSLKNYGYVIDDIIYDLEKENIFNIKTEYEEKFGNMGIKIKYLKAIK